MSRINKGANINDKSGKLLQSFSDSILKGTVDIGFDFVEATIDSVIENPIFEAIPFVKAGKSIIKGFIAVRDRRLLKKTLYFLAQLENKQLSREQLEKYKSRLKSEKQFNDELERVLEIIDREIEIDKIKYQANLFSALIQEVLSYELYRDYTEMLDKLFLSDLRVLVTLWKHKTENNIIIVHKEYMRSFNRLSSQGLTEAVFIDSISGGDAYGIKGNTSINFILDEYSLNFANIALFGINNITTSDDAPNI